MDTNLYCLHDIKCAPVVFQKANSGADTSHTCKLQSKKPIDQIILFTNVKWEEKNDDLSIDIYIINDTKEREKLCTLSKSQSCFQWNKPKSCGKSEKSYKIVLEASITSLISELANYEGYESGPTYSPTLTKISDTESEHMKKINETTPLSMVSSEVKSPLPPKNANKRKQSEETTPKPKSRRQKMTMRALTPDKMKTPPSKQALLEIKNANGYIEGPLSNDRNKMTCCVDLSSRAPKPSNRWGHTMCLVNSKQAVLIGGQGEKQLSHDSIWILDPEMRTWKCPNVTTEGSKPEFRVGHTATYDPTMRCIYIYGGSKNAKWFHDVHMFDLDENKWTLVKASGKAPTRAYHSTTLYRHELWMFGGVYPRPHPQPDGCDNEVHIFSPVMGNWYMPIVTGDKPRPRSGHSATLINDLLVIFGGWDFPYCYDDLFILDLTTVDWSSPKVFGLPPKPRSWHASCALSNNRIFIHGGYDGDNALHDAFVFNMDSKSWQNLALENPPSARAGHACLRLPSDYENKDEDEIIVFGGGDNDGSYFNDMLSFYVPFQPKVVDSCE